MPSEPSDIGMKIFDLQQELERLQIQQEKDAFKGRRNKVMVTLLGALGGVAISALAAAGMNYAVHEGAQYRTSTESVSSSVDGFCSFTEMARAEDGSVSINRYDCFSSPAYRSFTDLDGDGTVDLVYESSKISLHGASGEVYAPTENAYLFREAQSEFSSQKSRF